MTILIHWLELKTTNGKCNKAKNITSRKKSLGSFSNSSGWKGSGNTNGIKSHFTKARILNCVESVNRFHL